MKEKRERNDIIVKLYTDPPHLSIIEIAKQFDISRQAVYAILKRHSVVIDKYGRRNPERIRRDEMIREYLDYGKSYDDIVAELKQEFKYVSKTTVSRVANSR